MRGKKELLKLGGDGLGDDIYLVLEVLIDIRDLMHRYIYGFKPGYDEFEASDPRGQRATVLPPV